MSPTGVYSRPALQVRFWQYVTKTETCWTWTGAKVQGYGVINVAQRATRAHRASWVLAFGAIPAGLSVLHRCDNPPCVRPDHLFLGTRPENSADMVTKRRQARGFRLPHTRLSEADRAAIASTYRSGGVSQSELARTYSVTRTAIERVIHEANRDQERESHAAAS